MRLKTVLFLVFLMVLGVIMSSFFIGTVLVGQVSAPFSTLGVKAPAGAPIEKSPEIPSEEPKAVTVTEEVKFIHADIQLGWMPWIIKQVSILIGGLSLLVFLYAGITLVISGDSEEQLTKSTKMIVFGLIGIALAAFSYSIIANVLALF